MTVVTLSGRLAVGSGTSYSVPLVGGVVATVLQQNHSLSVADASTIITRDATLGVIKGLPSGSYNRLLYAKPRPLGVPLDTLQPSTSSSLELFPSLFFLFFFLFFFLSGAAAAAGISGAVM